MLAGRCQAAAFAKEVSLEEARTEAYVQRYFEFLSVLQNPPPWVWPTELWYLLATWSTEHYIVFRSWWRHLMWSLPIPDWWLPEREFVPLIDPDAKPLNERYVRRALNRMLDVRDEYLYEKNKVAKLKQERDERRKLKFQVSDWIHENGFDHKGLRALTYKTYAQQMTTMPLPWNEAHRTLYLWEHDPVDWVMDDMKYPGLFAGYNLHAALDAADYRKKVLKVPPDQRHLVPSLQKFLDARMEKRRLAEMRKEQPPETPTFTLSVPKAGASRSLTFSAPSSTSGPAPSPPPSAVIAANKLSPLMTFPETVQMPSAIAAFNKMVSDLDNPPPSSGDKPPPPVASSDSSSPFATIEAQFASAAPVVAKKSSASAKPLPRGTRSRLWYPVDDDKFADYLAPVKELYEPVSEENKAMHFWAHVPPPRKRHEDNAEYMARVMQWIDRGVIEEVLATDLEKSFMDGTALTDPNGLKQTKEERKKMLRDTLKKKFADMKVLRDFPLLGERVRNDMERAKRMADEGAYNQEYSNNETEAERRKRPDPHDGESDDEDYDSGDENDPLLYEGFTQPKKAWLGGRLGLMLVDVVMALTEFQPVRMMIGGGIIFVVCAEVLSRTAMAVYNHYFWMPPPPKMMY